MQKVALALLLVAVGCVSAGTFSEYLIRERRQLPLGGATGTGSGGLLGAGVGANGQNSQEAECKQANCAQSACTVNNNQANQGSGSGGLLGLGQLVGNVAIPINLCPSICVTCNQLGLGTLG